MPPARASRRSRGGGGGSGPPPSPVELAIRWIGPRRRFEREVRGHLRRKGVPARDAEAALARLGELGLVDDAETSRAFLRDRLRFSPRGRALLAAELAKRGVAKPVAEAALDEVVGPAEEREAALAVLRRSAAKRAGLAPAVARRRMWSALGRRGFPPDVVREALATFAEEAGLDPFDEEPPAGEAGGEGPGREE